MRRLMAAAGEAALQLQHPAAESEALLWVLLQASCFRLLQGSWNFQGMAFNELCWRSLENRSV
jgi:hypothetical protein